MVSTVTFGPGVTRASHSVPIVDDSDPESDENFAAILTTTETNVNIGDRIAIINILDDDDERKLLLHHIHKEEYWSVGHMRPVIVVHIIIKSCTSIYNNTCNCVCVRLFDALFVKYNKLIC